jgi:hypothetical protein
MMKQKQIASIKVTGKVVSKRPLLTVGFKIKKVDPLWADLFFTWIVFLLYNRNCSIYQITFHVYPRFGKRHFCSKKAILTTQRSDTGILNNIFWNFFGCLLSKQIKPQKTKGGLP